MRINSFEHAQLPFPPKIEMAFIIRVTKYRSALFVVPQLHCTLRFKNYTIFIFVITFFIRGPIFIIFGKFAGQRPAFYHCATPPTIGRLLRVL